MTDTGGFYPTGAAGLPPHTPLKCPKGCGDLARPRLRASGRWASDAGAGVQSRGTGVRPKIILAPSLRRSALWAASHSS